MVLSCYAKRALTALLLYLPVQASAEECQTLSCAIEEIKQLKEDIKRLKGGLVFEHARLVTKPRIVDGAIDSGKIEDGTVGYVDIANNAIDGTKIKDGTVGLVDIANNAIDGSKIKDGTIGRDDIASNAIDGTKIKSGSIGSSDVLNGSLKFEDLNKPNFIKSLSDSTISDIGWTGANDKRQDVDLGSDDDQICFLSGVNTHYDHETSGQLICRVYRNGGRWKMQVHNGAGLKHGGSVACMASCIRMN